MSLKNKLKQTITTFVLIDENSPKNATGLLRVHNYIMGIYIVKNRLGNLQYILFID